MRGLVAGLESPHPLLHHLPAAFQDGDFTARFVAAFDTSLAPVFTTLDNLEAHVAPATAPEDLLTFVGSWVGAHLDDRCPVSARRLAVAEAVEAHRRRGTAAGLAQVVRHLTGGRVEVTESGGTSWSTTPRSGLPGTSPALVRVRVAVEDLGLVDVDALAAAIADALPPHVRHELDVVAA
jgi:phage tail-like protein